MRTTLQLFFLLFIFNHLHAQQTFVPDDNFEQALIDLGLDDVLDNFVLSVNIEPVFFLEIPNRNIADLTGIEDFTNLTELLCNDNEITSLNMNENTLLQRLECFNNEIVDLNIRECVFLENLLVDENQLTTLDISQNLLLVSFTCDQNQLTYLDFTNYTNLEFLSCRNNFLNGLDVRNGNNINMSYFNSSDNPDLTCIFVDDAAYSENSSIWFKDPASTYVETQAECDALGINDNEFQNIQFYPNPVRNTLNIDFDSEFGIVNSQLVITDVLGKTVYQTTLITPTSEIDISPLLKGIYILKITNQNKQLTRKIIKL